MKCSIRTDSAPRSVGVLARSSDNRAGVPDVADVFAQQWPLRTGTSALRTAGVLARSRFARSQALEFSKPDPSRYPLRRGTSALRSADFSPLQLCSGVKAAMSLKSEVFEIRRASAASDLQVDALWWL